MLNQQYASYAEASSVELQSCNFTTPKEFDPYLVNRKLYGPWFDANSNGRGQMLILGQHNSGTSMLARLLMLMGAFQGNVKGTHSGKHNRALTRVLEGCQCLSLSPLAPHQHVI
jgi:hypothetical protein